MAETQYQKRMKVRRMSDIERLAREYSKNVQAMTGQYEQSYAAYQKDVAAKMAPYEAEVARYQSELMPAFESQKAAYQSKLDQYNAMLAEIAKNPVIERTNTKTSYVYVSDPTSAFFGGYMPVQQTYKTYEKKPIPAFTEKAPTAPAAPVRPVVQEFDTSKFAASKAQAEKTFQREVGERKAARLGAVGRRITRPMLQEG